MTMANVPGGDLSDATCKSALPRTGEDRERYAIGRAGAGSVLRLGNPPLTTRAAWH